MARTPLTWRSIANPNFSDSNQMFTQSARAITDGFKGMGEAGESHFNRQVEQGSKEALAAMSRINSSEAWAEAQKNGQQLGGVDARYVSPEIMARVDQKGSALLKDDATRLDMDRVRQQMQLAANADARASAAAARAAAGGSGGGGGGGGGGSRGGSSKASSRDVDNAEAAAVAQTMGVAAAQEGLNPGSGAQTARDASTFGAASGEVNITKDASKAAAEATIAAADAELKANDPSRWVAEVASDNGGPAVNPIAPTRANTSVAAAYRVGEAYDPGVAPLAPRPEAVAPATPAAVAPVNPINTTPLTTSTGEITNVTPLSYVAPTAAPTNAAANAAPITSEALSFSPNIAPAAETSRLGPSLAMSTADLGFSQGIPAPASAPSSSGSTAVSPVLSDEEAELASLRNTEANYANQNSVGEEPYFPGMDMLPDNGSGNLSQYTDIDPLTGRSAYTDDMSNIRKNRIAELEYNQKQKQTAEQKAQYQADVISSIDSAFTTVEGQRNLPTVLRQIGDQVEDNNAVIRQVEMQNPMIYMGNLHDEATAAYDGPNAVSEKTAALTDWVGKQIKGSELSFDERNDLTDRINKMSDRFNVSKTEAATMLIMSREKDYRIENLTGGVYGAAPVARGVQNFADWVTDNNINIDEKTAEKLGDTYSGGALFTQATAASRAFRDATQPFRQTSRMFNTYMNGDSERGIPGAKDYGRDALGGVYSIAGGIMTGKSAREAMIDAGFLDKPPVVDDRPTPLPLSEPNSSVPTNPERVNFSADRVKQALTVATDNRPQFVNSTVAQLLVYNKGNIPADVQTELSKSKSDQEASFEAFSQYESTGNPVKLSGKLESGYRDWKAKNPSELDQQLVGNIGLNLSAKQQEKVFADPNVQRELLLYKRNRPGAIKRMFSGENPNDVARLRTVLKRAAGNTD